MDKIISYNTLWTCEEWYIPFIYSSFSIFFIEIYKEIFKKWLREVKAKRNFCQDANLDSYGNPTIAYQGLANH